PTEDVAAQGLKIDAKFRSLAVPLLGETVAAALLADLQQLETLDDTGRLLAHVAAWQASGEGNG
ncbi:MAG: hypothetical protein QGF20_19645, partial [Alphaproteobacteria bacterium]|nr:hypothetical protein [Alphaproteobacteria bacterium]